jgi:dihydrofolate synthase/folylpolyglutamate synthase
LIARDSADTDFLNHLVNETDVPVHFFMSLPDDKDFRGVYNLLKATGAPVSQIILTGERGFLCYDTARQHTLAYEGAFDDVAALKNSLKLPAHGIAYFIGTQTFLRLIKRAYFQ